MSCSCCGGDKPTTTLRSRDDVQLCRDCLEWLLGRVGVTSTPTLPVVNMAKAAAFYERAGFGVRIYQDENGDGGAGFAFVDYDGAERVRPRRCTRPDSGCQSSWLLPHHQ